VAGSSRLAASNVGEEEGGGLASMTSVRRGNGGEVTMF